MLATHARTRRKANRLNLRIREYQALRNRKIMQLRRSHWNLMRIARKFGISEARVCQIVTWNNVYEWRD